MSDTNWNEVRAEEILDQCCTLYNQMYITEENFVELKDAFAIQDTKWFNSVLEKLNEVFVKANMYKIKVL